MVAICHLEIKETIEQLHQLLNRQKEISKFQKIQALYLLKSCRFKTVQDIADVIGVHRVTVQRWLKKYRDQGLEGLLKQGKSTGRPSVVSAEVIAGLQEKLKLAAQEFKSYGELRDWLQEQQGIILNYKTIYALVKYRLKSQLNIPK